MLRDMSARCCVEARVLPHLPLLHGVRTALLMQGNAANIAQKEFEEPLSNLGQDPAISNEAKQIIRCLQTATLALCSRRGEASITAAVVKDVFYLFFDECIGPRCEYMQRLIRELFGKQLGVYHTYAAVASLSAVIEYAHDSQGRRKLASFAASLLTGTVEHGLVVLSAIVPNDRHECICAALCGLFDVPLPDDMKEDEFLQRLWDLAPVGGPLAGPLVALATDHFRKDKNVWARCARQIVDVILHRTGTLYSPWGMIKLPFLFEFFSGIFLSHYALSFQLSLAQMRHANQASCIR